MKVHCFTGQLPGTDCFYTGQSPDVLEAGKVEIQTFRYGGWRGQGGEGWEISVQVLQRRRCGHLDTRAARAAAWSDGGLEGALALASMRMKLDASLLHLPPTSMPRTTKRHLLFCNSSG